MKRSTPVYTLIGSLSLLAACATPADDGAVAGSQNLGSGNGITVTDSRWVTARTIELDISTPLIDPIAVNGPHHLRVTVPNDYNANPSVRYPAVYLLHGGAGGNAAQWTEGGGAAEAITDGKPVITVMADGGKVGWFTNWVDESNGAQKWQDFYFDQVIPWVDANFRTVAAKDGRAIAGLSMGGYGAVRFAQDRPDLFASVASFSGAVDLGDGATRLVISQQCVSNGLSANGPFGSPFAGQDQVWSEKDPMKRVDRLAGQGVQILLYAGAGFGDIDLVERTMAQSTNRFSQTLDFNNIPHSNWMYGRPGPDAPFACDGGHNFSCWNFAFADALPRMLSVLRTPNPTPSAPGANIVGNPGFENGRLAWEFSKGGIDTGGALSHSGDGNGWVREQGGWNDIHQPLSVTPNRNYTVSAWIRTSENNTDGYFGIRTTGGRVVGEKKFARFGDYTQVSVTVNSGANSKLVVFGGFWAVNGDTWIQVDDVSVAGE